MFNGIRLEPTNKRLNSAYLQIKFLICIKIHSNTFLLDKTFFLLITSHNDVLGNFFFENKIIGVKQVALEKSLRLHTRGGVIIILLKKFRQNPQNFLKACLNWA